MKYYSLECKKTRTKQNVSSSLWYPTESFFLFFNYNCWLRSRKINHRGYFTNSRGIEMWFRESLRKTLEMWNHQAYWFISKSCDEHNSEMTERSVKLCCATFSVNTVKEKRPFCVGWGGVHQRFHSICWPSQMSINAASSGLCQHEGKLSCSLQVS